MGQCTSRKATGSLTTSTFVSHINPKKMEKHKNNKGNNDEESRKNSVSTNEHSQLLGAKKPQTKYSKGVAMSFGFKRRPTPMTANTGPVSRDLENLGMPTNDPNGNKDESSTVSGRNQTVKDRTLHKLVSSQKPTSITPRPSRFGFHQNSTDRTNKVADIRTAPSPTEFGGIPQNANKSRLTSPTTEFDVSNDKRTRTFTRNVAKTETTDRRRFITDNNENSAAIMDRLGGAQIQVGKFTFQTTRLPQPEPIRVIETKTAKTIANNNKKSARIWRQYEEASMKVEALTEDSGFSSNTSGYLGENDHMPNFNYIDASVDDNRLQHSLRSNTHNIMENSDSFSETGTPPPLPKLPSNFPSKSTITAKDYAHKAKQDSKKTFIKLGTQRTFLKSRTAEDNSSPHSSSEYDWTNAGEAMAEDTGLLVSPKHKHYETKELIKDRSVSTCATVVEAALQTLVKPVISLELTPNLKMTQKMPLLDDDPNFTAVATNNKTGHLLDEEILSPVESLLSSSETEEILKKKPAHSSSNSKDVNEKLTPASPETPSNGTYSLSLSDDKEDFLIDDEIADQPELVFEDTMNNVDNISLFRFQHEPVSTTIKDSMMNQRAKAFEIESSPLSSRKRRDFLRSITGSFDSLSPCESIASDDLMMEYDVSQSNDIDSCDRHSGAFSPLEDTMSTFRFKSDETSFPNKNLRKSSSSKPLVATRTGTPNYIKESPRLIKGRFTHQSSPESRSPKHNPWQKLGYHSMAYDPSSDCLMLTKANHSAIQQDIIGIKTMLLTLKRVLNESETQNLLNNDRQVCPYENNSIQNINNNNEFKVELADLRRQVIFLQGQLEDKEKTVNNLQEHIDYLANQNTHTIIDTPLLPLDIQNRCNAATQTERIRPMSGSFGLSGSSLDDNGSLVSFGIGKVVGEIDHFPRPVTSMPSC